MEPPPLRLTQPTRAVLEALLADPGAEHYGFAVGAAAGLASGTVHPLLARLEARGWVTSRWEDVDPRAEGRPVRRYYRLTPDGSAQARTALALRDAARRPARTRTARLLPGAVT